MGASSSGPAEVGEGRDSSFGPSALATPANAVTIMRLLLAPVVFSMILDDPVSWSTLAAWTVLAGSDGVDGWLARRQGTTRSGAFLDPLADKVLVLGALVCLASLGRFSWVPVSIIAVREVAVSGYRAWFGRRGLAVPARATAKAKTLAQSLAVGGALLPLLEDSPWAADAMLWCSVALAVLSAVQYFLDGSRAVTDMARSD